MQLSVQTPRASPDSLTAKGKTLLWIRDANLQNTSALRRAPNMACVNSPCRALQQIKTTRRPPEQARKRAWSHELQTMLEPTKGLVPPTHSLCTFEAYPPVPSPPPIAFIILDTDDRSGNNNLLTTPNHRGCTASLEFMSPRTRIGSLLIREAGVMILWTDVISSTFSGFI